jgi:uncharacterized protein (TIGR03437 family)
MRLIYVLLVSSSAFGQSYTVATIAGGAPRPAILRANASIGSPAGVTVDAAGNVYFFSLNCIFKLDPSGTLTRVAGDYTPGYSGDGGPATDAQLDPPHELVSAYATGLSVDAAGNVYIPDSLAGRVRKVTTSGAITTVAGDGTEQHANSSGEGGPAIDAFLGLPNHLTFDSAGNLYIAEGIYGLVHKVTPAGILTTVAGGGQNSKQIGDGGPAVGAYIASAVGVAIDGAGNLFISDPPSNRVRKVSPAGIITTFAGTGVAGYSGDAGAATSAQLSSPQDLAVDAAGNLYITDQSYRIRKVTPAGVVTTVAGNGAWGYSGDGGAAMSTAIAPKGLAIDAGGNLFLADGGANRIRKISTAGTVTTLAGDGTLDYSGDGGPAVNAALSMPGALAADGAGNLYIADIGNNRVRKLAPDGTITTVAGNGNPGYSGDGGQAVSAEVMPLSGLTLDGSGNLYIAEGGRVRKVTPGGIISTISGTAGNGPAAPLENTAANSSNNIAADSQGDLYLASAGNQKIGANGSISTFSNSRTPAAVALDAAGNLYASDPTDNEVFKISPSGVDIPIVITPGNGCQPLFALPFYPIGLAVDSSNNLYVADESFNTIRRISPAGPMDVIAGNFTYGYSGDGGPATAAAFEQPVSITVDGAGKVYVADAFSSVVRVLKPVTPPPGVVAAVTNGASNLAGPISAGEIVTLYGSGLGPAQLASCINGPAGLIDTVLDGTQVFFNGTAANVLYTSANQVAAVVPTTISSGTAQVSVTYQGQSSAAVSAVVSPAAPALFTINSTGKGQAAAVNQDGSVNSALKPAGPGEFISLYATGGGSAGALPVTVTIAGQTVAAQYAGQAPGYLAGFMQINAQIPSGIRANSATPVSIQVGSAASQAGVTIAVAGY